MRYGSVCSGIEAASCAWHPLGWKPEFLCEIDRAPAAFLAKKYPDVPRYSDMTKFKDWPDHAIDLLVGGTPCQSFSVAGLRKGLADPRGNLALVFLAIADRYRPRWLVWENVPGVLSSNGGRDFGSFLGGLGELGYGFAYRVLDAQYVRVESHPRAVPQRRRRVFVVGHLGDWRRAAAVLFERESLRGDSPPRREAGKGTARGFETGPHGGGFTDLAPTMDARAKDGPIRNQLGVGVITTDVAPTMRAGGNRTGGDRPPGTDVDTCDSLVAHALRGEGHDASEDGTGRGTPIVPVAFDCKGTQVQTDDTGTAPTLRSMNAADGHANGGGQLAVAFTQNQREEVRLMDAAGALAAEPGMKQQTYVQQGWAVRRLTPLECTRLQGFPDDYFNVPTNKPFADGPIYKMLGNSMAVNCMRWIGERIAAVEALS